MGTLNQAFEMLTEGARAFAAYFATVWVPVQLGLIVLGGLIALAVVSLARRRISLVAMTSEWPAILRQAIHAIAVGAPVIVFIAVVLAMRLAVQDTPALERIDLLVIAAKLAAAWVVIAVVASLIRNRLVNRIVSVTAWTIAALSILGLLEPALRALDAAGVMIGGLRVTILLVLKTTALLLLTLWAASLLSNFIDSRLHTYSDLTPSIRVLLGKLFRIAVITFAVLVVLSSVGIDFSALALFSGAVGVGVGFGLQKIVSNLVSGIILLADKSIKPGDVISVGDSFGWVDTMGARYTSVVSRDGREYLIPNEDFVTQRVVNWSFSNDRVRLDLQFGVSYASDPHSVRRLAVEAAQTVPRVLESPPVTCHFLAFGDSALEFLLRFWIRDPVDGLASVRSEVLLALWDALKREGIEIPFPQRDLHVKDPVRVVMERAAAD
jgi:small-conductance mechanosensitive channel